MREIFTARRRFVTAVAAVALAIGCGTVLPAAADQPTGQVLYENSHRAIPDSYIVTLKTSCGFTADSAKGRLLVEGVNRIRKHTKVSSNARGAKTGGIVTQEAPIHVSNVMVVCPECEKPTRIGKRQDVVDEATGKTRPVRVCKRCGKEI